MNTTFPSDRVESAALIAIFVRNSQSANETVLEGCKAFAQSDIDIMVEFQPPIIVVKCAIESCPYFPRKSLCKDFIPCTIRWVWKKSYQVVLVFDHFMNASKAMKINKVNVPFIWHSIQLESWILAFTPGWLTRAHGSLALSRGARPSTLSKEGITKAIEHATPLVMTKLHQWWELKEHALVSL